MHVESEMISDILILICKMCKMQLESELCCLCCFCMECDIANLIRFKFWFIYIILMIHVNVYLIVKLYLECVWVCFRQILWTIESEPMWNERILDMKSQWKGYHSQTLHYQLKQSNVHEFILLKWPFLVYPLQFCLKPSEQYEKRTNTRIAPVHIHKNILVYI